MQWSEVLARLPPETATALVNGLSIGTGQAALAGRRAARDASVTAVERALTAALVAWSRSVALLPDELRVAWVAPALPNLATPPDLPAMTWSTAVMGDRTGPRTLDAALADVLAAVRRSTELVLADAVVTDSLTQLAVAIAAVTALRTRLLALADDRAAEVECD